MFEYFLLLMALAFVVNNINQREQRGRIGLLGTYLARHKIENLMENLIQGYMRALGESDTQRQASIWSMLGTAETELCQQFNAFAQEFSDVRPELARVSKLPIALPYAAKWLSSHTFDMRRALSLHAHAIAQATCAYPESPKERSFTLMAELLLMQHSCHWFCRSKLVASARLLARHKTPYPKVLASVAPQSRQAYCKLVGCAG